MLMFDRYLSYTEYECDIARLVQERRNSIANTLELSLSCINPWICGWQTVLQQFSEIGKIIEWNN